MNSTVLGLSCVCDETMLLSFGWLSQPKRGVCGEARRQQSMAPNRIVTTFGEDWVGEPGLPHLCKGVGAIGVASHPSAASADGRMLELKRKRPIPQELDWDDTAETEENVVPACVLSEDGAERALDALTEASEPHAREHCPTFPFAPGLELDYCHQCTCAHFPPCPPLPWSLCSPKRQVTLHPPTHNAGFVCDVPAAECEEWGQHCVATRRESKWRQAHRHNMASRLASCGSNSQVEVENDRTQVEAENDRRPPIQERLPVGVLIETLKSDPTLDAMLDASSWRRMDELYEQYAAMMLDRRGIVDALCSLVGTMRLLSTVKAAQEKHAAAAKESHSILPPPLTHSSSSSTAAWPSPGGTMLPSPNVSMLRSSSIGNTSISPARFSPGSTLHALLRHHSHQYTLSHLTTTSIHLLHGRLSWRREGVSHPKALQILQPRPTAFDDGRATGPFGPIHHGCSDVLHMADSSTYSIASPRGSPCCPALFPAGSLSTAIEEEHLARGGSIQRSRGDR